MGLIRHLVTLVALTCGSAALAQDYGAVLTESARICWDADIAYAKKLAALQGLGWTRIENDDDFRAAHRAFSDGQVALNWSGSSKRAKDDLERLLRFSGVPNPQKAGDPRFGVKFKMDIAGAPSYFEISPSFLGPKPEPGDFDSLSGAAYCATALNRTVDPTLALPEGVTWEADAPSELGHFFFARNEDPSFGWMAAANINPISYLKATGKSPTILTYVSMNPQLAISDPNPEN